MQEQQHQQQDNETINLPDSGTNIERRNKQRLILQVDEGHRVLHTLHPNTESTLNAFLIISKYTT